MSIYRVDTINGESRLNELSNLWEALELDETVKIISITGAGGKTSVMFRLAEELKAMGKRVIVTTSTHILYPENYQTVLIEQASGLSQVTWKDKILVAGGSVKEASMPESGEACRKLCGMEASHIAGLAAWCDVLLIEADGSRRLPLKAPASHEPVIIPETDAVIGCAGLTSVGKAWEAGCFRPELAVELLEAAGHKPEAAIRPEDVAYILTSWNGTRKHAGERPYRIVLNQADGERELRLARQIVQEIRFTADIPIVITSILIKTR